MSTVSPDRSWEAPKSFQNSGDDCVILREASLTDHAASKIARTGFHDLHATFAQNFQIRLGGWMVPHVDVHRRCDNDRCSRCEIQRRQEVRRDALREVSQNIGCGGNNDESIDRLRDCNVLDGGIDVGLVFLAGREHAGNDFFSGERGEGKRLDELLGGAGHDDLHADATVLQQTQNFSCFVRCDSAGDAEGDLHIVD